MTKIKTDASNIIKNQTSIIDLKIIEKNSSFQKSRKVFSYLSNSLLPIAVIIIGLVILLYLANMKSINSFISRIGYALVPSGLIILIPSILGLSTRFIRNIAIGDIVIKNIVIDMANQLLVSFLAYGVTFTFLGIIIVIISFIIFKKSATQ